MIPSRLNLLSPEKRRHLSSLSNFQFIKNILELLLIIICLGGMVLLGGQYILQNYLDELTASLLTMQNQHVGTNRQIKEINSILLKTEKIQKEYHPITPLIPEIVSAIPADITLQSLTFSIDSSSILFNGHSTNRDTLLLFQKQLEEVGWINLVEIPISQLTEKENVDFSFGAKTDIK
ncbi:MAG: hypothetical protein ABIJ23_05120 [Candidatus Magasanikbacteria bacterium]